MTGADKSTQSQGGPAQRRRRGDAVRERILTHLNELQQGNTHVVTTTKAIAEKLDLPSTTVAYAVRKLVAAGMLSTKSLGPRGQRFVVERTTARGRPGRRPGSGTAVKTGHFCPWCGQAVQPAWKYCTRCGQRLPRSKQ